MELEGKGLIGVEDSCDDYIQELISVENYEKKEGWIDRVTNMKDLQKQNKTLQSAFKNKGQLEFKTYEEFLENPEILENFKSVFD